MAYPGLILSALVALLGVGFAYYSYSQENQYENSHQNHNQRPRRRNSAVPRRRSSNYPSIESINECCICFENTTGANFITTNCGHTYHQPCLIKWQTSGSKTCPLCRSQIQVT